MATVHNYNHHVNQHFTVECVTYVEPCIRISSDAVAILASREEALALANDLLDAAASMVSEPSRASV